MGYAFGTPTTVTQNTTATNDLDADGYTWANGNPLIVDKFGKLLAWAHRLNGGTKVHLPVVSADNGATWTEPTRTSFHIAAGEDLLIRGTQAYDTDNDCLHVCWVLTQGNGGVIYRQYSIQRDGSNNITGVTRTQSLVVEAGVSGMTFESPVAVYCTDIKRIVIGWTAVNGASASGTKSECRLMQCNVTTASTAGTLANWAAPLVENAGAGATDTLGSTGLGKYSCVAKSASAQQPWLSVLRMPSTATTHANHLVWFYVLANAGSGVLLYNRAAFATTDWSGGLKQPIANDDGWAVCDTLNSGTDSGYIQKYQLLSKSVYHPATDTAWVAYSRWSASGAGDCWNIVGVDSTDSPKSPIRVYSAGSSNTDVAQDMFVTGDVMYDVTSGGLVVAYTTLLNHDVYVVLYQKSGATVALDNGPTVVYTATPCDIPTLYDARINSRIALLFRDFNVGFRTNPPVASGGPYAGYYVSVPLAVAVGGGGTRGRSSGFSLAPWRRWM